MAVACFGPTHGWDTANLSASLGRYQLDFLRLGGGTVFHPDHDLCLRALFRDHVAAIPPAASPCGDFATAAAD